MTATSEPRLKITYATLRNDNEQLHAYYDAGLLTARGELGGTHGLFINGEWRPTQGDLREALADRRLAGRPLRERHPRGRSRRHRGGSRRRSGLGPHARGWSGSRSCAAWRT